MIEGRFGAGPPSRPADRAGNARPSAVSDEPRAALRSQVRAITTASSRAASPRARAERRRWRSRAASRLTSKPPSFGAAEISHQPMRSSRAPPPESPNPTFGVPVKRSPTSDSPYRYSRNNVNRQVVLPILGSFRLPPRRKSTEERTAASPVLRYAPIPPEWW